MRVNLALGQVGMSQVGLSQLGLVLYSLLFSFKDASAILVGMCFIQKKKKNVQQKFEGTMFGPIRDPIMCRKTYHWSVNRDYIT